MVQPAHSRFDDDAREQQLRINYYYLLSQLLCKTPTKQLLSNIAKLGTAQAGVAGEFAAALAQLAEASAKVADLETLDDEFHDLFVGLGRGEILPYASWYATGMLMDKPLSLVRQDLKALGIERTEDHREPEDHLAALFDTMGFLIDPSAEFEFKAQQTFFDRHIRSWARRFFKDLMKARKANYYKNVGRFGLEFIDFEAEYLSMPG